MKIKINLWLILIVSFGFFLRFYRLSELAMFVGDQGRDYLAARDILLNQRLTLTGPQTSISWLYLGSFFYYFLALFLRLGNFNPIWPIYGTALFGVLAIYLIYLLGEELFGKRVGLISAFFYAISPFAILQSRISLHPSVYPVFVIVFLLCLERILREGKEGKEGREGKEKKGKYWFLLTGSFLVAIQLHLSAVLLVPIFILSWEQMKLKSRYLIKLFLVVVGLTVVWKVFRHSSFTPISFWWKMFQEVFSFGNLLGVILALVIVIIGVVRVISPTSPFDGVYLERSREAQGYEGVKEIGIGEKILKMCLLVTALGLTVKNSSAEHYFNLFLPIIILTFSFGLSQLLELKSGRILVSSAGCFFLITNCFLLINSNYFSQFYGPNLSQRIKLAKFIVENSSGQPFALKRCGPLWDFASTNMNYEYLVWWLGGNKGGKGRVTYYIFEPREAWETKEGCTGVGARLAEDSPRSEIGASGESRRGNEGKVFEFEQAIVLKVDK